MAHNVRTKSSLMATTFLRGYQNDNYKPVELACDTNKKEDLNKCTASLAPQNQNNIVQLQGGASALCSIGDTSPVLLPQHNSRFYTFFCTVATRSESVTELRSEFMSLSFLALNLIHYKTMPSLTINTILHILIY